jgi:hypothetical protein
MTDVAPNPENLPLRCRQDDPAWAAWEIGALRARVRELQGDTESEAEAAYRDDACDERPCDYCGTIYRGPAVYCRLACALADA